MDRKMITEILKNKTLFLYMPDDSGIGDTETGNTNTFDIKLKVKNNSSFLIKTKVKIYEKSVIKNIIDFFDGRISKLELDDLGGLIYPEDKILTQSDEIAFDIGEVEKEVTLNIPISKLSITSETTKIELVAVLIQSSETEYVLNKEEENYYNINPYGYVSKQPILLPPIIISNNSEDTIQRKTITSENINNAKLLFRPLIGSFVNIKSEKRNTSRLGTSFQEMMRKKISYKDGEKNIFPILGFIGKSKVNEEFNIKIESNNSYDNTYPFRIYNLSIYKKNVNGEFVLVSNGGPFEVSFSPDAIDENGTSFFIVDILNKYFDGELEFFFNEDAYEELVNKIYDPSSATAKDIRIMNYKNLNPTLIDFLFNTPYKNKEESKFYEVITYRTHILSNKDDITFKKEENKIVFDKNNFESSIIDSTTNITIKLSHFNYEKVNYEKIIDPISGNYVEQININYLNDFIIKNGDSGSWNKTSTIDERENAIVNAYLGIINPNIFNKKMYPIDLVYDSNQSQKIRNAIYEFLKVRTDVFGFFGGTVEDTNVYPNKLESFLKIKNYYYNNPRVALYLQNFNETDKYSGRNLDFSATYVLSKKVISNDIQYGVQAPLAGEVYGVVGSNTMKISYIPSPSQEEDMYNNRVNYFAQNRNSTYLGTQSTSQIKNSALSEISIMRSLLKFMREIEEIASLYIYMDFKDPAVSSTFLASVSEVGAKYVTMKAFYNPTFELYATDYDLVKKRRRLKVSLETPDLLKQIVLDFVIN